MTSLELTRDPSKSGRYADGGGQQDWWTGFCGVAARLVIVFGGSGKTTRGMPERADTGLD